MKKLQEQFHCQLCDHLLLHPSHYHLHDEWLKLAKQRELRLHKQNTLILEKCGSPPRTTPSRDATVIFTSSRERFIHLHNSTWTTKLYWIIVEICYYHINGKIDSSQQWYITSACILAKNMCSPEFCWLQFLWHRRHE